MAIPKLTPVLDLGAALGRESPYDAVVAVFSDLSALPPKLSLMGQAAQRVDAAVGEEACFLLADDLPGGRLVLAPTGPLGRDHDDVRRVGDAAAAGMRRAVKAGAKRPVFLLDSLVDDADYSRALEVGLLAALAALWQPLEAREARGEAACEPVETVGFTLPENADGAGVARWVDAIERGRRLARDMGGTEPERMAPPRMAALCVEAFEGTPVTVEVVDDPDVLAAEYPLMMGVARASMAVERHRPRVIRLRYRAPGEIEQTLMLAGKGVSYDTGGADLKTGGHMAGMSRDKGGAAAVAGLMLTAALLEPRGVALTAEIGAVRNSIGPDSFVSDEIITSHAGTRVRIGNTDAEGRLVLADLLSHLREEALDDRNPGAHLFTVATLTGHSVRAMGPYPLAMDNGAARGAAEALGHCGDVWGDPIELSRLRREDFDFVKPRSKADDVLSCNNAPSSDTPRGHQFPMAFLILAAGLKDHHLGGEAPIAYTHLDVGGGAFVGCDWQHGAPTGTPIVAMAARYFGGRV